MRLLVDFLCRFGWGLAAALAVTPARLVPGGFFRVNLLVVMGLATFAALIGRGELAWTGWWLPAVVAAVAWWGSVLWYGERVRGGIVACVVAAVGLAAAVVLLQEGGGAVRAVAAARALVSGLVTGLTVHAMLLGHWYLNAPGMRVDALRRMIDWALAAWAVQLVATIAAAWPLAATGTADRGGTALALVSLRWLAGLVGLPVLLVMSRKTLDIPNTQSATGILYVACLAAILGELTSQLLQVAG